MSNIVFTVLAFFLGSCGGWCLGLYLALTWKPKVKVSYCFDRCCRQQDLIALLKHISDKGLYLQSVTQSGNTYTVFWSEET